MEIHHLVRMANEIGEFFELASEHDAAINSIVLHLQNFWEPRMRRQIIEYAHKGGGELKPIVREAVLKLEPVAKSA